MTNDSGATKVIPFCRRSSIDSIRKLPLKIHGAETSSVPRTRSGKRQPPLIALFEETPLPESLLRRLRKLDAEQLQIMELIADAIARGAL